MKTQAFCIGDIRPNPFRGNCPLKPEKVARLRESVRSTGFWPNIVARIGKDGKPEIAYGHHRLEAARQELGEDAEVELVIRDLSDGQVLKMFVRENAEEWGSSADIEQATLAAVVKALFEGAIPLSAVDPNTPRDRVRFAPSFICGGAPSICNIDPRRAYTSTTLAEFVGWKPQKVRIVLEALALIERGVLESDVFEDLGVTQARVLVTVVSKADAKRPQQEPWAQLSRTLLTGRAWHAAEVLREGKAGTGVAERIVESGTGHSRVRVLGSEVPAGPWGVPRREVPLAEACRQYKRVAEWFVERTLIFKGQVGGKLTPPRRWSVRRVHAKVRAALDQVESDMGSWEESWLQGGKRTS